MDVLSRECDPIGFGAGMPTDEYECDTGPIATLLPRGAHADAVAATLSVHRSEHLGLDPDPTIDRHAAEESIRWYRAAIRHAASGDSAGWAR